MRKAPDYCRHPGWCDWFRERAAANGLKPKGCRSKRCDWDIYLEKYHIPDIEYDEVCGWRKKGMP